jgi:hypothetical protein
LIPVEIKESLVDLQLKKYQNVVINIVQTQKKIIGCLIFFLKQDKEGKRMHFFTKRIAFGCCLMQKRFVPLKQQKINI